jgi:hypothetical protein
MTTLQTITETIQTLEARRDAGILIDTFALSRLKRERDAQASNLAVIKARGVAAALKASEQDRHMEPDGDDVPDWMGLN